MAKKRINRLRFIFASTLMLAACAGTILSVRMVPDGGYSTAVALSGGVLFTIILASFFEWLVHRYLYHRKRPRPLTQIYRMHHQGHHYAIFPTWRYTSNGKVRRHPVFESDISRLYPVGWQNIFSKAANSALYLAVGFIFL